MIPQEIMQQLQKISKERGKEVIREVCVMNGKPIYELRFSYMPPNAKIGYPEYYSILPNSKIVYELEIEEIREVLRFLKSINGTQNL